MLVRFDKKSSCFVEGSLGLVLHDAVQELCQGLHCTPRPLGTFSKVRHNKENLRAFDKAIKKLSRAYANCTPFGM